jgi:two-component system, OmpR family, KDP operon response regulator KdpE
MVLRAGGGSGNLSDPRVSTPSVLVVEDDPSLRVALAELLDEAGFKVSSASNGYSGLRLAALEHPRVVLLDLGLPELTGVEVLHELRASPETRDTAVIVITGNTSRMAEARVAGADLVVEKPFDLDELLAAVQTAANRRVVHHAEIPPVTPPLVHPHTPTRPRAGHVSPTWRARRRNG